MLRGTASPVSGVTGCELHVRIEPGSHENQAGQALHRDLCFLSAGFTTAVLRVVSSSRIDLGKSPLILNDCVMTIYIMAYTTRQSKAELTACLLPSTTFPLSVMETTHSQPDRSQAFLSELPTSLPALGSFCHMLPGCLHSILKTRNLKTKVTGHGDT